MIEQMKKVSVLALDSKRQQVVSQMQDAGVIHLEVEPRESEDLAQLRETRAYVERATMVLPRQRPEGVEAEPEEFSYDGALSTAKYLNEVAERRRELEDRLDQLLREELRLEPWGDFDPADLEELRRWDVDIQLYTVTQKQFKSVSAPRLFEVNRSNGQVYFAVAYLEGEERLELTPVSLPDRRLAEIRSDIEEKRATLEELGQRIADRFPER
jgi:V/A-type H+-transporting ATPase subunit I